MTIPEAPSPPDHSSLSDEELNRLADAHVKKLDAMPPPKRKRVDAPMDGVVVEKPPEA